jgi:hypothetical protein
LTVLRNVAELLGFAALLGFLYFCWPPLVLLGVSVLLVAWANMTSSPRRAGALGAAVGTAVAAARKAWSDASKAPSP